MCDIKRYHRSPPPVVGGQERPPAGGSRTLKNLQTIYFIKILSIVNNYYK